MSREKLPYRRLSWTQKVKIDGQTFYLTVGEFPDGRPGEVWLEASKCGTFTRGALDSLARTVSLLLQAGTPIEDITKSLSLLNFPPNGEVYGNGSNANKVTSVSDWVAQELSAVYCSGQSHPRHQGVSQ
jgi:ribonucleoside-diphosphate reductase alpha chain